MAMHMVTHVGMNASGEESASRCSAQLRANLEMCGARRCGPVTPRFPVRLPLVVSLVSLRFFVRFARPKLDVGIIFDMVCVRFDLSLKDPI